MIKSLLFFCACILAICGYAQKNVLVSDTTFVSKDTGRTFSINHTDNHNYNSFCQDTLYVYRDFQNPANTFSFSDSRIYNADGTLHIEIFGHFDSLPNTFIPLTRYTHLYSQDKLIDSSVIETWRNGMWQPYYIVVNTFDTKGHILSYLNKVWDVTLMTYTNSGRSFSAYNASGKNTYYETQYWNASNTSWVLDSRYFNSYNELNFLIASSSQFNEEFSSLYLKDTTDYYVRANGLIDSSINTHINNNLGVLDTSVLIRYHSYYDVTNKIKQVTSYRFRNKLLDEVKIDTYYYDTTNNFYTDSTISKYIYASDLQDTVLATIIVHKRHYNTDSTLVEEIVISYDKRFPTSSYYQRRVYHYASCQSILPVTLLSFTGEMKNTDALLHWAATNEGNALHYVVQRSTDGVHFTTIGNVIPAGHNAYQNKYDYTDKDLRLLQAPKVFYRLAQTDKNGAVTYTKIVTLYVSTNKLLVALSPNPVQNMLAVYSPIAIAGATICVADVNGRQFYTSLQNLGAGSRLMIDMSAYPKGMYLVTIRSDKDRQMFKVVK